MKPFTIHYRRRGTTLLLHAKVYSDSLSGATMALLEWEGDIVIITKAKEN